MQVDDFLDVGIRPFSGIDDGSFLASLDDFGHLDVLQFADASDALHHPQFVDEGAMHTRIDQCLAQWSADDSTWGQVVGHRLVLLHEDIGVEHFGSVPRIAEAGFGVTITLYQREIFGILQGDDFLLAKSRRSLAPSTTGGEKQDYESYMGR